jgi:hypothetical protein
MAMQKLPKTTKNPKAVKTKPLPPPPTTAIGAYKALQKALNVKSKADDEDESDIQPEVNFKASTIGPLLCTAIDLAFSELAGLSQVACISKVAGKKYFAFQGKFLSRPVNSDLFRPKIENVKALIKTLEAEGATEMADGLRKWKPPVLQQTLYSMAMAFCCAIDVQKEGDKKTPGTFFEYLVGYLISRRLHVNPTRRVVVASRGTEISLPTDFIFDPGKRKHKLHVPVKTSTRERVIQVWAHQRVIDGTLGQGKYLGTPVIMTETKLDKKKMDVVEICLPEQWQIYQGHISQLTRIYYLDVPPAYVPLNTEVPPIAVRPFADFFYEADALS